MVAVTINGKTAEAAEGATLFDCAEGLGIQVPTSCRKQGKCKECIVEVAEGLEGLSEPTEQERHLKGSFRLSCQARVALGSACPATIRCHTMRRANLRIERHAYGLPLGRKAALEPAVTRDGGWILIDGEAVDRSPGPIHGIAMDLGTTTIVLRLFDLASGEQIADTSFENPQRFGGSDVMARISYDGEHRGLLMRTLAGYLTRAIEELPVNPRPRMDGQQASPSAGRQAGAAPLALGHFDFRNRPVRVLPDRIDALSEKKISHGGVAHHHHLVDAPRVHRKLHHGARQIARQRARQ